VARVPLKSRLTNPPARRPPGSAHLGDAGIIGVKRDAAQHQVARLQVSVYDDALAARQSRSHRISRVRGQASASIVAACIMSAQRAFLEDLRTPCTALLPTAGTDDAHLQQRQA